jgi:hypothetical protein
MEMTSIFTDMSENQTIDKGHINSKVSKETQISQLYIKYNSSSPYPCCSPSTRPELSNTFNLAVKIIDRKKIYPSMLWPNENKANSAQSASAKSGPELGNIHSPWETGLILLNN